MIVVDASAFETLSTADLLRLVLDEFDVHPTETVVGGLEATADHDDVHGDAARLALDRMSDVIVHESAEGTFQSSRIDVGEGTCAVLAREEQADLLITDDLRALPELQTLSGTRFAISPIVLRALVDRGALAEEEATEKLDRMARDRSWLGRPIYRRARQLLEE